MILILIDRQHKHRVRSAAFLSQHKHPNAEDINLALEPNDGLTYSGSLYKNMSTRPTSGSLPRYSSIDWTSRNEDSDASSSYDPPRSAVMKHQSGK